MGEVGSGCTKLLKCELVTWFLMPGMRSALYWTTKTAKKAGRFRFEFTAIHADIRCICIYHIGRYIHVYAVYHGNEAGNVYSVYPSLLP